MHGFNTRNITSLTGHYSSFLVVYVMVYSSSRSGFYSVAHCLMLRLRILRPRWTRFELTLPPVIQLFTYTRFRWPFFLYSVCDVLTVPYCHVIASVGVNNLVLLSNFQDRYVPMTSLVRSKGFLAGRQLKTKEPTERLSWNGIIPVSSRPSFDACGCPSSGALLWPIAMLNMLKLQEQVGHC